MEVLIHAAKEHRKNNTENIYVNEKKKKIYKKKTQENFLDDSKKTEEIVSEKYKFSKCQEIVYKKDSLKPSKDKGELLCSLCTILHYYDQWPGQPQVDCIAEEGCPAFSILSAW